MTDEQLDALVFRLEHLHPDDIDTRETADAITHLRTALAASSARVAAALEGAAQMGVAHADQWTRVAVGRAIRALITPEQSDALAAHVAAEVAKARAEDAELLYSAWLGLRVLNNIAKVKGLSGAADVTISLLAEIEAAHPEFAPRSALRSQIGAKP